MGYYTDFTLEISDEAVEALYKKLLDWADKDEVVKWKEFSAKWYEYGTDMIELSEQFPDELMIVHGQGEDDEDRWKHYFKGGKHSFCQGKIIFNDFSEENLKLPEKETA